MLSHNWGQLSFGHVIAENLSHLTKFMAPTQALHSMAHTR